MGSRYWKGAALGGSLSVAALAMLLYRGGDRTVTSPALVFDPPFVRASHPWILPDTSQEWTVRLVNRSGSEARIDEFRFSCPCAKGTVDGAGQWPVRIAARDAATVRVNVESRLGENGPVELRFGAVGHIDGQAVEAGGVAALRFVQHLNAEPAFLTLENMDREDGRYVDNFNVWIPGEVAPLPTETELVVESDDPCLLVRIDRLATPEESVDGGNRKVLVARVNVTVDPQIAAERLKAYATVRSGSHVLQVPVIGFVRTPDAP